ncbi:MAG: hypothetical protein AAFU86_16350, partial [Pseudomonadota bacterium]
MPKSKKRARSVAKEPQTTLSRRTMLGGGAAVSTIALGGGFWGVSSFRSYAAEHDLSRVGQGAPTIVQVHDPQCATCTA